MSTAARQPGRRLVVEADGGSRGNPGVAGYGALVRDPATGQVLVELAEPLGLASNNVAEYSGLIAGLAAAIEIDPAARVLAKLDSKLVVEQMSGRWKIKHEDMRRLALAARDLCADLSAAGGSVDFEWIPRERNQDADALSNEAMDGNSVRRVLTTGSGEPGGAGQVDDQAHAPAAEPATSGSAVASGDSAGLRLLLVQTPSDAAQAPRVVRAVRRLVGPGARVVSGSDSLAAEVCSAVAAELGTQAEITDEWSATPAGPSDERVRAAYVGVVAEGGTVVAVTSRRGVLTVLAEVLATPADRFFAVATAPGSLTAVEVWDDGSSSVAFTNRTDHLA